MATRSCTINTRTNSAGTRDCIVTWTGLLNGDDGQWLSLPGAVLRSVSATGVFGAGGSIRPFGSNGDAIGGAGITGLQPDETALVSAFSTAGLVVNNLYVATSSYRPVVTAGDGTTNLTMIMYFVFD